MALVTTEITKEQLNVFVVCAKHYLNSTKKRSKLFAHLEILTPKMVKLLKKVERERELVRLNLCKKTSSQHIERNKDGKYLYTEENEKKVLEKFDEIDEAMVKVPTLVLPKGEYPEKELSYDTRQAFAGIVIPANQYMNDDGERLSDEALEELLGRENEIIKGESEKTEPVLEEEQEESAE